MLLFRASLLSIPTNYPPLLRKRASAPHTDSKQLLTALLPTRRNVPAPISPCGLCQQVLREVCAPDITLLLVLGDNPQNIKDKNVEKGERELSEGRCEGVHAWRATPGQLWAGAAGASAHGAAVEQVQRCCRRQASTTVLSSRHGGRFRAVDVGVIAVRRRRTRGHPSTIKYFGSCTSVRATRSRYM